MHGFQAFSIPLNVFAGSDPGYSPNAGPKRRPIGTPDPDAEVIFLSPETLTESDRHICEICNQSFRREQNLQMHRRQHRVPWNLQKREIYEVQKKVYVCPETSCLHHDPDHALGDLAGIKKHFRRKHSNQKNWICVKCSKGYAVHSDYKAHLKTCGTKGHTCNCGRVFSRVETFIEHQELCKAWDTNSKLQDSKPAVSLQTSPIMNFHHSIQLQMPLLNFPSGYSQIPSQEDDIEQGNMIRTTEVRELSAQVSYLKDKSRMIFNEAMEQMALADEKRQQAKSLLALANEEIAMATKIREQVLNQYGTVGPDILQLTCNVCKKKLQTVSMGTAGKSEGSIFPAVGYINSHYNA